MPFEDNKATILQFVEGFNQGNLGVIDELILPDFYGYSPKEGEETAPEVLGTLSSDLVSAFPDLQLAADNFVDGGDTLDFDLTLSGTFSNNLWGAPGNGLKASWTSTVTSRFDDGRFAFYWQDLPVPSVLAALREIDLVPPPDKMDQPPKHPISIPEFLIKLIFTGQVADKECSHLDMIQVTDSDLEVCPTCVEMGDVWPALRMCLVCGFVGCCDTSKNKHMKQHYEETGHPIFRSIRLQESWVWCYEDNTMLSGKILDQYRN
jgi:predicted ester cyclase